MGLSLYAAMSVNAAQIAINHLMVLRLPPRQELQRALRGFEMIASEIISEASSEVQMNFSPKHPASYHHGLAMMVAIQTTAKALTVRHKGFGLLVNSNDATSYGAAALATGFNPVPKYAYISDNVPPGLSVSFIKELINNAT